MYKNARVILFNEVSVKTDKGYSIAARVFGKKQPDKVLIISSAAGVKQSFYKKFAEFISNQNITVITFDYVGIGLSLDCSIDKVDNGLLDWGSNDLEAIIKHVKNNYKDSRIIILGHSIGGQLIGLAKSASVSHKIILISAQSGYWKFWKGFGKCKMWFTWYILFPIFILIFGYMPSKKISSMENLPKNVASQWKKWCTNQNYLFGDLAMSNLFFKEIVSKIIAISIDDDDYAPKKAVDWLTEKYENADILKLHLYPKNFKTEKIGHFGVFKERFKNDIWRLLLLEIEK